MTALCHAYDDPEAADRAVAGLLGAGAPGDDVRLLMGAEVHDARREGRGGFGAAVAPDAGVADFGGGEHTPATPRSSFAGTAAAPGEGVFANADRDVVVTFRDGRERERVSGHRALKRLLVEAGLDADAAEADVRALHAGRILVLVDLATIDADAARAALAAP